MYTLVRSSEFEAWFETLRDEKARVRITGRLRSATFGNFGDCKPVGEGVSEMRIHVGAGYRIYYVRTGSTVYVLLTGGDKSSQGKDIIRATGARNEEGETMKKPKKFKLSKRLEKMGYKVWDAADYLTSEEMIAEYLAVAAEDPNPKVFLAALGDAARARGMGKVAKKAGLGRESLYKALNKESHPRFETISAVMHALGVKFAVEPVAR